MPNTLRMNLPYPGPTATAQIPTDISNLASTVDSKAAIFIQQSDVPSAPTPVQGAIWWCTNTASSSYGLNYSDGSVWYPISDMIPTGTSDPVSPFKNQMYFNTTSGKLRYYNGSAWSTWFQMPPGGTSGQVLASTGTSGETQWQSFTIGAGSVGSGALASGVTIGATAVTAGTLPSGVNLPATQVTSGALPSGVTIPATQLTNGALPTGVTLPATQVTTGALASGVTLAATQLTTGAVPSGVTVPATQVTTGALSSGVTLGAAQLTTGTLPSSVTVPVASIGSGSLPSGVTVAQSQIGALTINSVTATATTYSPVLSDAYSLIVAQNTANNLSIQIPTNASIAYPIGTQLNFCWNPSGPVGAYTVTITAASSGTTTINSTGATSASPVLRVPYCFATAIKIGTDSWLVSGDII
jgi:hypothetical protein